MCWVMELNSVLCNGVIMIRIMKRAESRKDNIYTSAIMHIIISLHTILYLRPYIVHRFRLLFDKYSLKYKYTM